MKGAFSLIELMVVIAIVAVLAAIAVPAYKDYVFKAALTSAVSYVNSNVDHSIRYYNAHGVFADAAQLGLPFNPGNTNTAINPDGATLVPGLLNVIFADNNFAGQCHYGSAWASIVINPPEGFDASSPPLDVAFDFVDLLNRFIDVDGVIVKRCHYTVNRYDPVGGPSGQPSLTQKSGNFIGGCVNQADNQDYYDETIFIRDNACD